MSRSSTRHHMRLARRQACSAHLSAYVRAHPDTVKPEVALRFLQFGKKPQCLQKFMVSHEAAARAMVVPEHVKKQARAMFARISIARLWKKTAVARIAEKKRQRAARRRSRT